jgi:hypothetical protein
MNTKQPELNPKGLYNFLKTSISGQTEILRNHGILLDTDIEKDILINLYFIDGFFVEETFSISEKRVIENIPFKQGYRMQNYVEIKKVIVPKKSDLYAPIFLN